MVVEKVQRNRKSRGEDQKNEARNRKTRNQVEENRDQVKDRKRMNEVMIRQAAAQVQTIGKTHLMMKKIQVWIFYRSKNTGFGFFDLKWLFQDQIDHDRTHREENGNVTVQDLLEVDHDQARDRLAGIMVPVIRAMADIKVKIGVAVVADEVGDENLFATLNRVHHFAVAVIGVQTILLMAGIFSLVENHPKHIPIVLEALQHQVHHEAVPQNIIKTPLTIVQNQNQGQKHQ